MLTPQMKKFGQEWINKRDESKAAVAAGVDKKFAKKIGKDWLALPEVRKYIDDEIEKTIEQVAINRVWILNEAKKTYFGAFTTTDKVSSLTLMDKLVTKLDEEKDDKETAPLFSLVCKGDVTIL